ncbi:MAG: YggT family protein [Clostridia bacterium]|nr:YggT family protein [Clostridia bacterium]
METVLYIIAKVVEIFLSLMSFAMLMRVLLQFFVDITENKLYSLCVVLTEPIVIPFRLLFAKFNIAENSPLDVPFMVAYLALTGLTMFLPII